MGNQQSKQATERNNIKPILWNLFLITTGSVVFSIGAEGVLVHHHFIIGGLYGAGLLIFYKTSFLSPGLLFFILNIPLLLAGWFFLSKRFFFYSLYGVTCITLSADLLNIDFAIQNQLYAAVAGGAICGAGSGIILRSTGSGGGLDIMAILLNNKYNFGVGKFFMIFNTLLFIVVASQYEPDLVIASIILTFISSISLEQVLALFNQRKIVYILSKNKDEIVQSITNDLHLGATLIEAKGAYSGQEKQMIMTITNNLQLKRLEDKVFTIDPDSLFIVENSFNVIGLSFGKRKMY